MTKLNEIWCEMRLQRMHVPTLDPRIVINAGYRLQVSNFKKATMRHCYAIRKLYVNRHYTSLTGVVSDKDRQRYPFVSISKDGTFTFSSTFLSAHDAADQAAEARRKADGR